jgi:L-amino acid N-acyltransferase YncA
MSEARRAESNGAEGAQGAKGAQSKECSGSRANRRPRFLDRAAGNHHVRTRSAGLDDAEAIAAIYNEGIEDGIATFETRLRTADDVQRWSGGRFPIVVVEDEDGRVIAFAATSEYRPRECYAGVAEFSVYAARSARRRGAGRLAMEALIDEARRAGFWKLVSRVFVENVASRELLRRVGFREVGIYQRHGKLHGIWRDTVIVERLLNDDERR